jgi:hypothetical protein
VSVGRGEGGADIDVGFQKENKAKKKKAKRESEREVLAFVCLFSKARHAPLGSASRFLGASTAVAFAGPPPPKKEAMDLCGGWLIFVRRVSCPQKSGCFVFVFQTGDE